VTGNRDCAPGIRSREIFEESERVVPGGVNSPVRSFMSVGGTPFVVERGEGPYLIDVDGRRYIDYVMSWGPLILGHADPAIVEAVRNRASLGTSFGAPTADELGLALLVRERMPWVEKLRLVSSGTEACMTAARVARGATGRTLAVKFDGGYHGHADGFLVKAGSGLATGNLPASAGVPGGVAATTVSLPYNDTSAIDDCFDRRGGDIACVIVEPVAANMGVVPPEPGFLEKIRDRTERSGALLIFDEVITGFRVAPGGAAELFGIRPDLVCLGKILGGGLPIGGLGGRADLMDLLAPGGPVYQAGTLSGNPLSTAAGIAGLKALANPGVYRRLRQYAVELTGRITEAAEREGVCLRANRVESLFTFFFSTEEVRDFASASRTDGDRYARLFHTLLDAGVFIPPSKYEAWFVSTSHGPDELESTVKAFERFAQA
jgi:glutamate-1-semialdehyde 2,1-aminomutase